MAERIAGRGRVGCSRRFLHDVNAFRRVRFRRSDAQANRNANDGSDQDCNREDGGGSTDSGQTL